MEVRDRGYTNISRCLTTKSQSFFCSLLYVSPELAKQNTGGGGEKDREEENKQQEQRGWGGRSNGTTLGSIPESKRHLVGILVNKYMYVGNMDKQDPNTYM